MLTTERQWGTIADAAYYLGVSEKTIRRMITRGDVRANRVGPRMIRVDMFELARVGRPLQYVGGISA